MKAFIENKEDQRECMIYSNCHDYFRNRVFLKTGLVTDHDTMIELVNMTDSHVKLYQNTKVGECEEIQKIRMTTEIDRGQIVKQIDEIDLTSILN